MNTSFLQTELESLRNKSLYRSLRCVEGDQGPTLLIHGREVINFCSNNYLGLANHPALREAAKEAIDRYGCGSGASRLISGNMTLHEELESKIAELKGTEAALVFNSGFQANTGRYPRFGRGRRCHSERCPQSRQYHRRLPPGARKDRCVWALRS